MGLWSILFSDKDDSSHVKVRSSDYDNAKITGDKFTKTDGGGHVHSSYTVDTASGGYNEYHGGENSSDRSYNK